MFDQFLILKTKLPNFNFFLKIIKYTFENISQSINHILLKLLRKKI